MSEHRSASKVKSGAYLGVTVDRGGYFHVFSLYGTREVPGWKHEIPVIVGNCCNADELDSMVTILIRELERLRKWSISYSKTETYERNRLAAWTRSAKEIAVNEKV